MFWLLDFVILKTFLAAGPHEPAVKHDGGRGEDGGRRRAVPHPPRGRQGHGQVILGHSGRVMAKWLSDPNIASQVPTTAELPRTHVNPVFPPSCPLDRYTYFKIRNANILYLE